MGTIAVGTREEQIGPRERQPPVAMGFDRPRHSLRTELGPKMLNVIEVVFDLFLAVAALLMLAAPKMITHEFVSGNGLPDLLVACPLFDQVSERREFLAPGIYEWLAGVPCCRAPRGSRRFPSA